MSESLYQLYIYSDNGSCIYKISSDNNIEKSMQGIIQALFYTGNDFNNDISLISSQFGVLAYKNYTYNNKTLLFALIVPDNFGDEELCSLIMQRTIDYIYNMIIIHIGLQDAFPTSQNEIESLKKLIEIYEPSLKYILSNYHKLKFILRCENKYEVDKECIYPIKFYIDLIRSNLKIDFICLYFNNRLAWCSKDWLAIDIIDRILFAVITEIYSDSDIDQIPIYFSKTQLEDETNGRVAYKLFCINLLKEVKLIFLADTLTTIKKIDNILTPDFCDEFFISRLISFRNIILTDNDIINTLTKSIVIINNINHNYKILIDESYENNFSTFIMNSHFFTTMFKKGDNYDEFYVKDENNCYYYYKLGNLTFLIAFNKETTFDDVNNVKLNLKTFFELFEDKELENVRL